MFIVRQQIARYFNMIQRHRVNIHVRTPDHFFAITALTTHHALIITVKPLIFFILDLTPGINRFHEDNRKTRRETFKFWIGCDLN